MIFDSLENADLYLTLGDNFEKAIQFLKSTDFSNMEEGKIEIDGEEIIAFVQKYKTIDPETGRWEAHRQYADIQFMVRGSEDFGFVNIGYLDPESDYDVENDIQWFDGDGDFLQLHDDEFVIVFPHEGHMPKLAIEKPEDVVKVVVKVAV
jgi:YhcH/YjgK/YiaL family protein